jgi:Transcriptional regulator
MMELRVLRYFLAVAREGSLTAAANVLHVTQPTLSKQIKELEERLGAKLLVRHSHSVTLTAEGMRLRKRAEEILDMVDKTEAEFNATEDDVIGEIHIGGGETRAMRKIAEIIDAMRLEHPNIRYELHSGNAIDVMERLDKGLLDFGILLQPADLAKYDYVDLPEKDEWGILMRKDSPLAEKKTLRRKDVVNLPLIGSRLTAQRGKNKNPLSEWFGRDFDRLNIVARYNLIYNATLLVEQGIGYALAIDGLANVTDTSVLCFRPLEPRLESGLNLVWKKYQAFSPGAQIFLKHVEQRFA